MVSSKETTPAAYLASLPPDRRAVIAKVRTMVLEHLPKGYAESMNWGMLCYEVPLSRYPETYNKQPLAYVALAAQKNNYALYLTNLHNPDSASAKLAAAYQAKGRKLDMGQSCLRFKSLDELPMDIIGEIIEETTVDRLIARYEASRRGAAASPRKTAATPAKKVAAQKAPAQKSPAKKAAAKKVTAKKVAATSPRSATRKPSTKTAKKAPKKR